jgi:hypothetical protein
MGVVAHCALTSPILRYVNPNVKMKMNIFFMMEEFEPLSLPAEKPQTGHKGIG